MSILKRVRKDAVIILWEDVYSNDSDWKTIKEAIEWAEINPNIEIKTIGWIIKKTDKYILVAAEKSLILPNRYNSLIRIPIKYIKKIDEFTNK